MPTALQSLIEKEVGGRFDVTDLSTTVSTAKAMAIQSDFERLVLFVMNLGTGNVFLSPKNTVSTTSGVKLLAGGGLMSLTAKDDFVLVGHEWWGISDSGTNDLLVLAVRRYNAGGG